MTTLKKINLNLSNKRKYLLATLNIALLVFIVLEIRIFQERSNIMSAEEFRQHRLELCNDGHLSGRQCARVGS